MVINANTKIARILKHNPASLDAIVSISPKFEKLRNPFLRKLMAGRTSLSMASKIGGCQLNDFFTRLSPLGFDIDNTTPAIEIEKKQTPYFLKSLQPDQIVVLDVRPVLTAGQDPLNLILDRIKNLSAGQALKIQNSFEPTPLILLLQKQGFESYVDVINDNLVETLFFRKSPQVVSPGLDIDRSGNWDETLLRFTSRYQTIDVRHLEMPRPMLNILEALDKLPAGNALYIYHKRIPVFLLPELAQREFDYRIKEVCEGEVHLLIFKK